jgi:aminopeptidase N
MKKFLILYIVFLLITINNNIHSQTNLCAHYIDDYSQPVDMVIDIINMKGEIKIDPYKQIVNGKATYQFKTLRTKTDSLIFQSAEIEFKSVMIAGNRQKFTKNGDVAIIYLENLKYQTEYEMIIEYQAKPTRELYFSGWNEPTGRKRRQIWAHSPNHWIPYINQKHDILTSEMLVTFDSKYKVFSNGDRLSVKDNGDGTKKWHYKLDKPHVVYLICLVIGDYDYKETKSKSGVPVELWYYPDQKDRVETTYMYMEKMIDFYEDEIGIKYPWNSYRQIPVVDYLYGGMETTTATIYGDYMFIDPRAWWMRNYVNVNAHELNHQWFGNLVSHLNNPQVWLTESFATYYAKLFERSIFGEDYYQWERVKELTRTMNAAKLDSKPIANSGAGSDRWYPKGSLVLDMMRYVMGDSEFITAIKYYVDKNYHQVTSTPDLLRAIRESTGYALDWFFDEWILRGGEPHYKVSYQAIENKSEKVTQVTIEQIHKTDDLIGYFKMPIEVEVYYKNGSIEKFKDWVDDQKTIFNIPNPNKQEIDFVIFDPNRKIIKNLTFDRSYGDLADQLLNAKNMIDRYDALLALKNTEVDKKRETLTKAYKQETYHLIKAEIVKQLANDSKSYNIIKDAINCNDEWVKRAVIENITKIPSVLEPEYRKLLKDSCYKNVELSLENLYFSFPGNDYLAATKDETGWRGKNIRVKWLELSIHKGSFLESKKYLDELIDYTSPAFEFETRMNAFTSLRKLDILNEKIIGNLLEAYLYWNNKLSPLAAEVLKYYYQQYEYKIMIDNYIETEGLNNNVKIKGLFNP